MPALPTVGSGLDIPKLVAQLVANERQPTAERLKTQGSTATAKLSALGSIKGALDGLQSALRALMQQANSVACKVSAPPNSGIEAILASDSSANKTNSITPGSHRVEVVQLAQAQQLASQAFEKGVVIGSGQISIACGSAEKIEVDIPPNSTLRDIANAINQAAQGKGVNASIIRADDGEHLVLNAADTGLEHAITLTASNDNGTLAALTGDGHSGALREVTAACNAKLRVDGFEVQSASNDVSDLLPGVRLKLTGITSGSPINITISHDDGPLTEQVHSFVNAWNTACKLIASASAYDPASHKAAVLTGDALVRGLQQQLRSVSGSQIMGLRQLGLDISKQGHLSLNESQLQRALAENPSVATSLLGKDGILSKALTGLLDSHLSSSGTLNQRSEALNKQIKRLEQDMNQLDARMTKIAARYNAQFTAMDNLVTQMQRTSDYLAQQLAGLQK